MSASINPREREALLIASKVIGRKSLPQKKEEIISFIEEALSKENVAKVFCANVLLILGEIYKKLSGKDHEAYQIIRNTPYLS